MYSSCGHSKTAPLMNLHRHFGRQRLRAWQCRAGQPGEITRLIGCDFGRDLIHRKVFWVMPTWVTPGVQRVGDDECACLLVVKAPVRLLALVVSVHPVQCRAFQEEE